MGGIELGKVASNVLGGTFLAAFRVLVGPDGRAGGRWGEEGRVLGLRGEDRGEDGGGASEVDEQRWPIEEMKGKG